ncbi:MAG: hypothetical protein CBC83_09550 [Flavobacteriales bacterium TMED123]|nr:MAG: hypothetical protein CBC83_09550 [Flavobacteriales bacterium TMED123]
MTSKYDTVLYTVTPPILQVHGGKVALQIDGNIPEKYFHKNATIDLTPVLKSEDSETTFKTITLQGEEANGGQTTIPYVSGGGFTYKDEITYSSEMMNADLKIKAVAKLKDDAEALGTVTVAKGVIATSQRVQNTEEIAIANHGYEKETILSEFATIYFLVNQSTIRTSEKSDDDIQKLKEFAQLGYKTHSIEIKSFASPEGTVDANDDVSERRNKSTVRYAKQILRKLKLDGANNQELYTNISYGEDWEGFNKLMKASDMQDKRRVLHIVNSVQDPEKREQAIRDMAELYDAIDKNILPQLRKAQISVLSYQPKRTDENIAALAVSHPDSLDIKELLFAATLTDKKQVKLQIYNAAVNLHNDWRAHNNIACIYLAENNLNEASNRLDKAFEISGNQADVLTNYGIIAGRKGNLAKAQQFFNQANASEKNQAILDIRQGKYAKAERYFKNANTHNATLAKILNGNNSSNCTDNTAACYYLNAIVGARSANLQMLTTNLSKAIATDSTFKLEAAKDLEFLNYRENQEFNALIN